MRLSAMETVKQATNLRVKGGGRTNWRRSCHSRTVEGWLGQHGRARRRGVRESVGGDGAAVGRPKVEKKEIYWTLI
jgi:hypothetical protein